jgi:protein-S-isoprenylcysteine O-methyltransferase Ste14
MQAVPSMLIWAAWLTVFAVWISKAGDSKRTEQSQALRARAMHSLAAVATAALLLAGPTVRLYRVTTWHRWTGAILTVAGCAFAVLARIQLGRNWSAHAVLKQGQQLIQSGVYAWTRHPIYTGLLAALAGTAFTTGRLRGALAFAVLALSFHFKANAEEELMAQRFPAEYPDYRRRVRRLIPLIW